MRRIGMAMTGLLVLTLPLAGQRSALREVRRGSEGSLGIEFVIAEPLGEFRRTGAHAAGLAIHGVTRGSPLGVRIDGGWMVYDAADGGYGVTLTSQIASLMVGPQVTLGQGSTRIYGFLLGGGSLFWSDVNYNDGCGCSDSDFIDGDLTFSRSAGAGVLLQLSRKVGLDLGVRETRHDRVSYFPAGGLTDNGNGTYTGEQVQTSVLQRVWQVGVSIALR
jgi:hypothetical protein